MIRTAICDDEAGAGHPMPLHRRELCFIGLSSVRRTAEKYLGCLKFDPDGRVFRVTVMVQEKQNHDQRRNASCQS